MNFHFSIDDVFESLIDVSHPMIDFLDEIDCHVDLYCFYQDKEKTLSDVSDDCSNHFKYTQISSNKLKYVQIS